MSGLPKAKQFPKLPDGYAFEVSFLRVNSELRVNEYKIAISDTFSGLGKVSSDHVPEELVLRTAKDLEELFLLVLAQKETKNRASLLTRELREIASK